MSNPPNLLDELRNALLGDPPYRNALTDFAPPLPLARNALLDLAFLEPEVREADRKAAAWVNLPGSPTDYFKTSESGRRICWDDHGDRSSPWGWEIDHRTPIALGGRHTRSNLIARDWEDNARAGGLLGALLKRY